MESNTTMLLCIFVSLGRSKEIISLSSEVGSMGKSGFADDVNFLNFLLSYCKKQRQAFRSVGLAAFPIFVTISY